MKADREKARNLKRGGLNSPNNLNTQNKMRAKFSCDSVTEYGYGNKEAKMSAVYDDGNPENNQFAEATPAGNLTIQIDKNATAKYFLIPGKNYYLDFTEAD